MAVLEPFIEGKSKEISGVPKILYKYRTTSCQHLDIILKRQIFFSKAECFNDPFDCFIPIRFDLLNEKEFDEMSIGLLCRIANFSVDQASEHYYNNIKGNPKFRQYSDLDRMREWQLKNLRENVTVFCLSQENDNILLWSHYAANHSGICIGFDRDFIYYNTGASCGRVEYVDDYLTLKPTPIKEPTHIVQVLTKAKKWEYEKEYRFVYWESKSVFDIEPKAIQQIIFGCRIQKAEATRIIKLVTSDPLLSHVEFFQAEKIPYTFKLAINPIK